MSSLSSYRLALWYILGFAALFNLPYIPYGGVHIRPIDIIVLSVVIVSTLGFLLWVNRSKERSIVRISPMFLLTAQLFIFVEFWPMTGNLTLVVSGHSLPVSSVIAPIRRAALVIAVLATYLRFKGAGWRSIEVGFLRGFIHGATVSVVWMGLQQASYWLGGPHLNKFIFGQWLGLNPGHTYVNYVGSAYAGIPLLRATGFSWDPGTTAPAIFIAWLLYVLLPESKVGPKTTWISIPLLFAPILSLSRTTIVGAVAGLALVVLSICVLDLQVLDDGNGESQPANQFIVSTLTGATGILFVVGIVGVVVLEIDVVDILAGVWSFTQVALSGSSSGVQRHLGYILLVPEALTHSWRSAVFGYSAYYTGAAMELVGANELPGILSMGGGGAWNPESSLVVYLLMGGIPGAIAWSSMFVLTALRAGALTLHNGIRDTSDRLLLTSMIVSANLLIMMFGYGMIGTWYYVLQVIILKWVWVDGEKGPVSALSQTSVSSDV